MNIHKISMILLSFILLLVTSLGATAFSLTDDLVSYYRFDGDTLDYSGNNMHLSNHGATSQASSGILGGTYKWDGLNDYMNTSNYYSNTLTNDYTQCFWMNLSNTAGDQMIFEWYESVGKDGFQGPTIDNSDGDLLKIYGYENNNWRGVGTITDDVSVSKWIHICIVKNSSHILTYYNGTLDEINAFPYTWDNDDASKIILGGYSGTGVPPPTTSWYSGQLDEFGIWNTTLDAANVSALYNAGAGYDPTAAAAASSTLDLIFANKSDDVKTSFASGEDFFLAANWTDDSGSTTLNSSAGDCNATFNDGVVEYGFDEEFSLCTTGCTNTTWAHNYTGMTTGSVHDLLHLKSVCHEQTEIGSIDVTVTGSSCSWTHSVTASEIPSCADGNASIFIQNSSCNSSSWAHVSLTTTSPNSQRKKLVDVDYDREFTELADSLSWDQASLLWNSSFVEYYDVGLHQVDVECYHNTDANFNNNHSENVTITAGLPLVFFNEVNTTLGFTPLSSLVNIEYAAGDWQWYGSVVQSGTDTLDTLNVSWYNSSGHMLHSHQGSPATTQLDTPAGLFLDFANPYSINVTVNTSSGVVVNASLLFTVNDTVVPSANISSPLNRSLHYIDQLITLSATCSDEALYRTNFTLSNSTHVLLTNGSIFPSTVTSWANSTILNSSVLGTDDLAFDLNLTCTDSHTSLALSDVVIPEKPALNTILFPFNDPVSVVLEHKGELSSFKAVQELDRWVFDINTISDKSEYVFKVYARDIVPIPDSKYPCHAVLDDFRWIDFDMPDLQSCELEMFDGYAQATVVLDSAVKNVVSRSLGELNSVTVLTSFNLSAAPIPFEWTGVTCGENYPYNDFTLNFSTLGLNTCQLKINNKLYDKNWSSDCGWISIETTIGEQDMVLTALSSNGSSVINRCNIWTDKIDKDLADYVWILAWLGVIVLLFVMGRKLPALQVLAGVLLFVFGFQLFVFSWLIAGCVVFAGLLVVFGAFYR